MPRRSLRFILAALVLAALGGGAWAWHENQKACCAFPDEPEPVPVGERPRLGLMTSLPLYWPLGAGMAEIASGQADAPWQRLVLEQDYELVPLDTLSPIPGLSPEDPETDPLEGLERLAVIQPRGLSPADNAALDDWVNGGGQLLLVLDPMLTGEYDLALGDPRRPVDVALIPPIVTRWGLQVEFDEAQELNRKVAFAGNDLDVSLAGRIVKVHDRAAMSGSCLVSGDGIAAQCKRGGGTFTLVVDAAAFEGMESSPTKSTAIQAFVRYAFDFVAD